MNGNDKKGKNGEETERDTDRDRQTDRNRQRQVKTDTDRQTVRKKDTQTQGQKQRLKLDAQRTSAIVNSLRCLIMFCCRELNGHFSSLQRSSLLPYLHGAETIIRTITDGEGFIVQELCESRGGRPGVSVLTSLLVSVDVKLN